MSTRGKGKRRSQKLAVRCMLGAAALLVVIAAMLLWGGQVMDPAVKTQLEVADALYQEGRFGEAEAAYLKVRELDPKNTRALERLGAIALWSNRVKEAEDYLTEALHDARGLQKAWPFNAQVKTQLAMTYYRADRFAEAAQLVKEATGPIALGPFRELKTMEQQLALFGDDTPYVIEGPEETRVNFVVTDPLPVVQVSVNGSEPLLFFIDTGGAELILDPGLAEEVGADIAGSITGQFAGPQGQVGLGRVDEIAIGEFAVKNVPIHTLDTDRMSPVFDGLDIKGVVGTRLLMHFLATIDYPDGSLILRRKTPTNLQELEAQINTQGVKAIPFWLIQTHYMVAWGTVNGREPVLFFVDTGLADKGFTATESALEEAGITVDWTKADEAIGGAGEFREVEITVDRLTLGAEPHEIVKHDVPGVAPDQPPSILGDTLGFKIGGLISHQFFRDHALTLDFTGMRLVLQKSGATVGIGR